MAEFEKCADAECDHFQRRQRHAHPIGTAERRQKTDHADAWNVAHHRKTESNLARAYIELRDVAWKFVHSDATDADRELITAITRANEI